MITTKKKNYIRLKKNNVTKSYKHRRGTEKKDEMSKLIG